MNPAEIEFLAEQEDITIIPKFSDSRVIHLISGNIGPFRAGIPTVVPLWVAVNLRRRQRCQIVVPDWMDLELVKSMVEEERRSRLFTPMPSPHYMEIVRILYDVALSDISNANDLRSSLQTLWDVRTAKAKTSSEEFLKGGGRYAGIDHITQLEICSLRPVLLDALDATHLFGESKPPSHLTPALQRQQSQPSSSSRSSS